MNRLPPSLLYLVVYNPTLKVDKSIELDDEDAEEQAHVLFYTANDHAVSKDRVLRQVGLAKALGNFTSIFGSQTQCEAVHSQSRRMVMISPEPNFWIHACVELEKSLRPTKKDEKGKGKQQEPVYDYNEASLQDSALRTRLLLGYESFKIMHGSFTSILSRLGREALELQLERFFTVWAWSLDFGREMPFSDYLGVRVHPLSNQLIPLIEILEHHLPPHYHPLVLASPCVVASRSSSMPHPPGLIRRLLSLIPNPSPLSRSTSNKEDSTKPGEDWMTERKKPPDNKSGNNKAGTVTKKFLGIPGIPAPTMNMNMTMDVRKWSWPAYLTIGMGNHQLEAVNAGSASTGHENGNGAERETTTGVSGLHENALKAPPPSADTEHEADSSATPASHVDSQALEDALSSEAHIHDAAISDPSPTSDGTPSEDGADPNFTIADRTRGESLPSANVRVPVVIESNQQPEGSHHSENIEDNHLQAVSETTSINQRNSDAETKEVALPPKPIVSFLETRVYLPNNGPLDTHLKVIRYLRHDNLLLALIPTADVNAEDLDKDLIEDLADRCMDLLERLKETITVEQEKIAAAFSSSPVQSVFQRSQHVITTPSQLNYTSTAFTATSWHLHDGRRTLEVDEDVVEIFSRGQSPADWHLVKRGLGSEAKGLSQVQGDVYMEIARKEASLTDVDSEIAGVVRRFLE